MDSDIANLFSNFGPILKDNILNQQQEGHINSRFVVDDFSFDDVQREECIGSICKNVCENLVMESKRTKTRYLTICIPCYNEDAIDLLRTIQLLMENVEFIKQRVRFIIIYNLYMDDLFVINATTLLLLLDSSC